MVMLLCDRHNIWTNFHTYFHTLWFLDLQSYISIDRATNLQLSKEVGTLPALSSTSPLPSISQLHSDLVVLVSRMGLELEALSRSVDATQQHSDSLAYHLLPSSNS